MSEIQNVTWMALTTSTNVTKIKPSSATAF